VHIAIRHNRTYPPRTEYFNIIAAVGVIAIVLETQNLLCPESFSLAFGNSWLQIIKGISAFLASTFLVESYRTISKDIALPKSPWKTSLTIRAYKPFLKFLSIKASIISFWNLY